MGKEVDVHYIKDAKYMSLSSPPATKEANRFTEAVVKLIKANETRKRRRNTQEEEKLPKAVGLILGDLLIAYDTADSEYMKKNTNGLSYHPLSSNYFTDLPVGYVVFRDTIKTLILTGLITIYDGRSTRPIDFGTESKLVFGGGFASRFKPTPSLISMATDAGLTEGAFHTAFITQMPRRVLEVRATKLKGQNKGNRMSPEPTERSNQMVEDVKAINDYLSSFTFTGMVFDGLRRSFNEGDRKEFDYNLGGRLYCAGGEGYIGLKKPKRAEILINGEEVVEIDINASYLTIFHALKGVPMPDRADIYDIGDLPRAVVKQWFSITMGNDGFHTKWLKGNIDEMKEAGVAYKAWMTMKKVETIILKHFPVMKEWPKQEVRWSNLMFLESEIIVGTMLELMRQHKAPSLPVHDCIIVRKSDRKLAESTLTKQFQLLTGITPRLKVK